MGGWNSPALITMICNYTNHSVVLSGASWEGYVQYVVQNTGHFYLEFSSVFHVVPHSIWKKGTRTPNATKSCTPSSWHLNIYNFKYAWLGGLIQPIASNKIVQKKNHLPQIKGINIEKSLKPQPKCLLLRPFFWGRPRLLRVFPPVLAQNSWKLLLFGWWLSCHHMWRSNRPGQVKNQEVIYVFYTRMEGQGVYNCIYIYLIHDYIPKPSRVIVIKSYIYMILLWHVWCFETNPAN